MSDIAKSAQILIEECARLEPCLAEVCADETQETKIVFENSDFSVATSSKSTVFGLRTIVQNRLGFITTNSLDPAELKDKAREAQMVARLSPPSPFHQIANRPKASGFFEMVDKKLSDVQAKDILGWAQLLVDEARHEKHVTLDRAEINVTSSTRLIQNSNGVFQKARQVLAGWFVMGMAKNGAEVTSFDYEGDSARFYSEVEEKIKQTAKEFRESVVGSLGAKSGKSYKGQILLHPAAVSSLVGGVVSFNVNGRAHQDGMSKWKDKLNSSVASSLLSMAENPLDETRPGTWTPFDREGVPTSGHDIIKDGVLRFTAHNCFSAKRGNTNPTGNAAGGPRSLPSIGLHGLTVATGKTGQSDLYHALGTGLVLKRFSGNEDPVSGEFSGVAKNSWWVENGKRSYPVKEVMVAGNLFDLLNGIKIVGAQSFRQMGQFDSPYILVDGISVTGN